MREVVLQALAEAAARGVQVTIITNDRRPVPLAFKWQCEERWWGVVCRFRACGIAADVRDLDGDRSLWSVFRFRGAEVIASGEEHDWTPLYHFDAALLAAEAAVRGEARRQIAELRGGAA